MIDSARWQQIQDLFEAALAAGPCHYEEVISRSGADAETRETVARMLRADVSGGQLLSRRTPELAFELLLDSDRDGAAPPQEEFGPYRLIRLLGEGGMGVVWLAERKDAAMQVAIKFLPNAGLSPARLERFTHEVRLLAKLKHPFVARLYDAGTLQDGTPWYVMEYVAGIPFDTYANNLRTIEEKIRLLRRVCDAVQYAHSQEIIHRDLKPSNILIEADGTPKLLDFGIARELQPLGDDSGLTVRGPRFISKLYSAPEWVQESVVGFTTDVYSLGVMLYELLAGKHPAVQQSMAADGMLKVVKPSQAATLGKLKVTENEWRDLDVLCLKAMHVDPAQRYASVEALGRDFDHFLKGEPLEAQPDSWSYRSSKFVRRNIRAVVITATVLTLLIAMGVVFTVRLAAARNAALSAAARSRRIQQFTLGLFESSGKASDAPATLTAETLVDRGATEAVKLTQEPELQADLYRDLSQMYQDIGSLAKADRLGAQALAMRESIKTSSVDDLVEDRVRLGLLRSDENRAEEGERIVREALRIVEQKAAENRLLRARVDTALGQILISKGLYTQGAGLLTKAAGTQEEAGASTLDWAETLTALADAELYQGHYDASDAVNQKLLTIYTNGLGKNDPHVGDTLQNLAETAELRGAYSKAETYEREALAIASAWYGKDHPETAGKMTALASTLVYEQKYAEAGRLQRSALEIQTKAYGNASPHLAYTLNSLGMTDSMLGDHDSAMLIYKQVVSIYSASYGQDDYRVGVALANLGTEYLREKRYREAERFFRQAVRIQLKARGESSPDTAIAHLKLGRTLLHESRFQEAEAQTRAGYQSLKRQSQPNTSFTRAALEDLLAEYDAMHRPEQARAIKAEMDAARSGNAN